ncbi:putative hydrolase of the alpha/beta superfamily [Alloalcanivorax dieselolei B5]|uniref:Acyl-CoA:diacylglycerol acyltransferase n=1 Tax=Alcanivorax dieselolei (strain DSM 16502 / CGMCC 1.3690 / MCCC 1A00001 / B-5) TaxID=930169 RepID=K0CFI1_ALCDB|nr:alpha/beta hydrolase-fold protein [Alloalcanivorax dieselolei]AFT71110.1 putative hydrolase of the alpha/beta superfamily [Alloalcanivorax dieselolei B5]GGJ99986.1 hypothetical protein GCM10007426_31390 [Alloalcanivorax dieselolei]
MVADQQRRRFLQAALAGACVATLPGAVLARPDMTRTMGTTLADTGLAGYRFESRTFAGAEGRRRHRVWLAIPEGTPPPAGFPALYLLDGNAVLSRLRPEWLTTLGTDTPPVLVMIGYDTALLFDGDARHYDYTPASAGKTPAPDPRHPQRQGGGGAAFLQRIESGITPWVMDTAPVNPDRKALWGHSFGGLFTLFALCTRPDAFRTYLPVSPSLGWADNVLRHYLKGLASRPPQHTRQVWLCRGSEEVRATPDMTPEQVTRRKTRATRHFIRFAADLNRIPRTQVRHRVYPGQGHGPMFSTALPEALRLAAGLAPDQDWSSTG